MTGRVLVVDDVPQNVKLLEAKLSSEYYTVYTASNGIEALAKARELLPDIILLDVMMPEMDGFECCRRLKADHETAYIPVVMVTALSEVENRVQGLEVGANDFVTKPIDEVHLFARVRSLVRLKVMMDELRLRDRTSAQLGSSEEAVFAHDNKPSGNILVIDDDVVERKRIEDILSKRGHRIQSCPPSNSMETVARDDFDIILINTILDDIDGLRLAMQIRSQEKARKIPILILVDEDDKPLLVKALEIGVDDYILTPMEPNELVARVYTQIKRKRFQDALRSSVRESISAAVMDSLTKLYNRRYLDAHLANIVSEALEKNGELSIMTIDIDHFKLVNDKPGWGHAVGDEVLQEIAERIRNTIRNTDLATRHGGEEFVVVMPNTNLETAKIVAERIRTIIDGKPVPISVAPNQVRCSVSIGIAALNKSGDGAEELLKRSDEALYEAKQTGRNRVVVSDQIAKW